MFDKPKLMMNTIGDRHPMYEIWNGHDISNEQVSAENRKFVKQTYWET